MRFRVELVPFSEAAEAIRSVRQRVFIEEQGVPTALEWDGRDESCDHILVWDEQGRAIGTGRLTPDDHVGRMAVLPEWRGRGVGSAMLRALVAEASRQGRARIALSAQTHALGFYERHGFRVTGDEYLEAGIPHRAMSRELSDGP